MSERVSIREVKNDDIEGHQFVLVSLVDEFNL